MVMEYYFGMLLGISSLTKEALSLVSATQMGPDTYN